MSDRMERVSRRSDRYKSPDPEYSSYVPRKRRRERRSSTGSSDGVDKKSMKKLERKLEARMERFMRDLEINRRLRSRSRSPRPSGAKGDIIPIYNPETTNHSALTWLNKIDQLGAAHGWNENMKSYYMQSRLGGLAKLWHSDLDDYDLSWEAWKAALIKAFPRHREYVSILKEMLDRKKTPNETITSYYYSKNSLLSQCRVAGKDAVSCIIDGLPHHLQGTARAGNYETPDELYSGFMAGMEDSKTLQREMGFRDSNRPKILNNINLSANIKCFRCNRMRHYAKNCRTYLGNNFQTDRRDLVGPHNQRGNGNFKDQPLFLRCGNCGRRGHTRDRCREDKPKQVYTLSRQVSESYIINVILNGHKFKAYLDTGSQVNVANVNLIDILNLNVKSTDITLKDFGGRYIFPVGIADVVLTFNDVSINSSVLLVSHKWSDVDLILGQPIISHELLKLEIHGKSVMLRPIQHEQSSAVAVVQVADDTCIPPMMVALIRVNICGMMGPIVINTAFRAWGNSEYALAGAVIDSPIGAVQVTNSSRAPLYLARGKVLCRGHTAGESVQLPNSLEANEPYHVMSIDLSRVKTGELLSHETEKLLRLLSKYRDCFAANTAELGSANVPEMRITLKSDKPIFYKPYRLPEVERRWVRNKVDDLLNAGIIRESASDYASPIILVRKKDGDYRMCVDYRKLNSVTIKDRYPLPNIEEQISKLGNKIYFTSLDMSQGFHQVPIAEESVKHTAFVTPDGQYEYVRMAFGLANAPSHFQRMINNILGNLRHERVLAYIDDLLLPSATFEDGLSLLETVLNLLRNANLKLNLEKCRFFENSIHYLGYEVSNDGIKPSSGKIKAVINFKIPSNLHEVRQFLGLTGYFRKFIHDYARIAEPISRLLRKNKAWEWGTEQQGAFSKLKQVLTSRPILAIYSADAETELHTDASSKGIAGILLQKYNGNLKPVAYFSKVSSPEESVYHSYELETLAIVKSIERFRIYLTGIHFKIITDCNAVRLTFTKRDMSPRVARWWLTVQDFDFDIEHRPGSKMMHADALSRNPTSCDVLSLSAKDWLTVLQLNDDEIRGIKLQLESNNPNNDIRINFVLDEDKRVYRKMGDGTRRLVLPKDCRWNILRKYHDDIGHIGLKRCETIIKSQFWFPKMTKFIKKYVNACLDCAYRKGQYGKLEGRLHPIQKPSLPNHTWHVDHLGPFCRSVNGNAYLIVVADSFTKYLMARAVKSTGVKEVIHFINELVSMFGTPNRLITDRGTAFKCRKFRLFCMSNKIKLVLNSVASPRSNGQVERFNRTILDAINVSTTDECYWDAKLSDIIWGINNTINATTGFSPHRLMFGFEKGREGNLGETRMDDKIGENRETALDRMNECAKKMKVRFDAKRKDFTKYKVGEFVLWRKCQVNKLGERYSGPYKITRTFENDRYKIRSIKGMVGYKKFNTVVPADHLRKWTGGIVDESSDDDAEHEEGYDTDELLDILEG